MSDPLRNQGHEEAETQAVVRRYARRGDAGLYSPLRPEVWQGLQERQRAMLRGFVARGCTDLAALHIAEVGCGGGGNLLELLRLGADPARLTGLELLPERHAAARRMLPAATTLWLGDALQAPAALLPASSQDVVLQSTVFSSLLDDDFQQRLAQAMWGWLKPGGAVLWYDFTVNNPHNRDVRGVPLRRLRQLFPQGRIEARRVTLAPPLARLVCRWHPALYTVFNSLPLLRTHVLAWVHKP
jgi:SAM-dependent methyltransferase